MQEDSWQRPEEESKEEPENHIEAKSICEDHAWEQHSSPGQELQTLDGYGSRKLRSQIRWEVGSGREAHGRKEGKEGYWCAEEETFGGKKSCNYQETSSWQEGFRKETHHGR